MSLNINSRLGTKFFMINMDMEQLNILSMVSMKLFLTN